MTASLSDADGPPTPDPCRPLPPELLDGVLDALMAMPSAVARAEIVFGLVDEMYACVAWLQAGDDSAIELSSLREVVAGARAHQRLLARREPPTPSRLGLAS